MSAILMNQIPIIPWKGSTFNQVVTHIKKNGSVHSNDLSHNIFSALPLKGYRKEIGAGSCSSSRNTTTIEELNRPGSSIVNSKSSICNGLVNIVDFNLTFNSSEKIGNCVSECVVGTPETNARRRIRSSGMIKKQFDLSTDKPKYYTDSKQYLNSRNKTYAQNNFHYFRAGDDTAVQGSSQSIANIYTTNTTTDCKRHYLPSNVSFTYEWVASNISEIDNQSNSDGDDDVGNYGEFTVVLKKGFYDVSDINRVLHSQMEQNEHFFIDSRNKSKKFFINFAFNSSTGLVQLQINPISQTIISNQGFVKPVFGTDSRNVVWNVPGIAIKPIINILDNGFKDLIGFTVGEYTSGGDNPYVISSNSANGPAIKPRYNPVYYKPNNHQYAQQGAVSSSSRITRLKYNAITSTASTYRNASGYGSHVANALAYGVPINGYTIMDKIGYPLPKTPTFTSTGEQRNCSKVSIVG